MSDEAQTAYREWLGDRWDQYHEGSWENDIFRAGFAAGEAHNRSVVQLMESLSINPAIPQGFRSIMKSALNQ